MGVGGAPLTSATLGDLSRLPHVTKVVSTLSAQLMPTRDTSLRTSIENFSRPGSTMGPVSMPIFGQSTDSIADFKLSSGHDLKLVSGTAIDGKSASDVAVLGKTLAAKNGLATGSTFTVRCKPVKVAGVFDTGNMWANNVALFPLRTLQTLSGRPDQVSTVYVQVDSADAIAGVQQAIAAKAGSAADLTTTADLLTQAVGPLEDIQRIATQDLIGCLVAGGVIIFLSMLMIVRERRREIGVLKAIGSSNSGVVLQFIAEALVLALLGSAVGGLIGAAAANSVFHQLMLSTGASTANGSAPVSAGTLEIGFKAGWGAFSVVRNASNGLHASVGFGIVLWGLLVALAIAVAGSAVPAWLIARIRPAEVMRGE